MAGSELVEAYFWGNILDTIQDVTIEVQQVCNNGPFDYPNFAEADGKGVIGYLGVFWEYANAFIWDKMCECKPNPDG
jgi:hypothetical protein